MPFEIKYQTEAALFHVKIERDVSAEEAHQLAQLALNITKNARGGSENEVYGPQRQQPGPVREENLITHIRTSAGMGVNSQSKLGERPIEEIDMGYTEPKEGVRIKMLAMPEAKAKAVFAFRNISKIRLTACKAIVYGNFPCPILDPQIAEQIMDEFRKLEVYAKIVPADNRPQAA
jgi:hypothetical protein